MSQCHFHSQSSHPPQVAPQTVPVEGVTINLSPVARFWVPVVAALSILFVLIASTAQAQIDRWFTVQPIQIRDDFGLNPAPMPMFQAETEKIYAQAGVAPIWLPTVQVDDSSMLTVSSVTDLNVPGNGQHADPMTINMWFVEDMDIGPSWILYGEAYIDGNGVAINGTEVQKFQWRYRSPRYGRT